MTKKEAYELGKMIMKIRFKPAERHRLVEAIPYLSEEKLKNIYKRLKAIYKSEQRLDASIETMKQDVASGKVKAEKSFK